MVKKSTNYINNPAFHAELLKYHDKLKAAREAGLEDPTPSDEIGRCIMLIAERYATRHRFYNYIYREEMILDAIEQCVAYGIKRFDPYQYNNPLAYFTTIINNAFFNRIKKERKALYANYKQRRNYDLNEQLMNNSYNPEAMEETQKMDDFIKGFEQEMENDKAKKKIKPAKGVEKFYSQDDTESNDKKRNE